MTRRRPRHEYGEQPDDDLVRSVEAVAPPLRAVVRGGRIVFLDEAAVDSELEVERDDER